MALGELRQLFQLLVQLRDGFFEFRCPLSFLFDHFRRRVVHELVVPEFATGASQVSVDLTLLFLEPGTLGIDVDNTFHRH